MRKENLVQTIALKRVKSFLIKGQKLILVDAGNPDDGKAILEHIRDRSIHPEEIDVILVTHAHPDHAGGLKELIEATNARVLVQHKGADNLKEGKSQSAEPTNMSGKIVKTFLPSTELPQIEPNIIISGKYDLNKVGVEGKIIHTPGHTPDSISIILNSREAIVGDLIMGGFIRKGTPKYPIFANDLEKVKESIEKVLAHNPKVIYTSHGGPFKKEDIEERLS